MLISILGIGPAGLGGAFWTLILAKIDARSGKKVAMGLRTDRGKPFLLTGLSKMSHFGCKGYRRT